MDSADLYNLNMHKGDEKSCIANTPNKSRTIMSKTIYSNLSEQGIVFFI